MLLTHAHEDHVGALPYLLREFPDTPVYGTRFTLAVTREKLAEHAISADLREVSPRAMGSVGRHTDFEPLQVPHSVPDAVGYAFRTEAGLVIHTGDFKNRLEPGGQEAPRRPPLRRAGGDRRGLPALRLHQRGARRHRRERARRGRVA